MFYIFQLIINQEIAVIPIGEVQGIALYSIGGNTGNVSPQAMLMLDLNSLYF